MAAIFFGALINAGAFLGGSFLIKTLTGKNQDEERKRHNLAVEKYQRDYNSWKEENGKRELWMEEQAEKKNIADEKIKSTDEAFRIYANFIQRK